MNDFKFTDNSGAYLDNLRGQQYVPVSELYDGFIRENTPYSSLKELLEAGGFKADTKEDIEAIPDSAIDEHVAKTTRFNSWKEIVQAVLMERIFGG